MNIDDKIGIYRYDPECKQQSSQRERLVSIIKTEESEAGQESNEEQVCCFFDIHSIVLSEFMTLGQIDNVTFYE